jgi:hypothetical protein
MLASIVVIGFRENAFVKLFGQLNYITAAQSQTARRAAACAPVVRSRVATTATWDPLGAAGGAR